jgi:hypothetical protein
MQYTLSLTPRMLTIAGLCVLLLCALLFLLGVEIGQRIAPPVEAVVPAASVLVPPSASVLPSMPAASAAATTKPL